MLHTGRFLLLVAAISFLTASAGAQEKHKALMITQSKGFVHGSVKRGNKDLAPAEIAMVQLGQKMGILDVHCSQDCTADFTRENLQNYDLVMFYTTGDLPISEADKDYFFKEWLTHKGHGFIGFHSASDTYHKYKPYWDMIGGTFDGHPWGSGTTVTVSVHDTDFPAMKPFGTEFQIKDEIYQYKNWQPEKVHVLMTLNMAKCDPKKPYLVPVAWCKNYGDGRVFYNNLGHNPETWTNPLFLQSTEAGIRWTLGLEDGDAAPNPELSASLEEKAKKDAGE